MDNQNNNREEKQQQTTQEEEKYLGRFTRHTWYGGILGAAVGYFLIGLMGMLNEKFSLGIDKFLNDSMLRYLIIILLVVVGGKIGSVLEKKEKIIALEMALLYQCHFFIFAELFIYSYV